MHGHLFIAWIPTNLNYIKVYFSHDIKIKYYEFIVTDLAQHQLSSFLSKNKGKIILVLTLATYTVNPTVHKLVINTV